MSVVFRERQIQRGSNIDAIINSIRVMMIRTYICRYKWILNNERLPRPGEWMHCGIVCWRIIIKLVNPRSGFFHSVEDARVYVVTLSIFQRWVLSFEILVLSHG